MIEQGQKTVNKKLQNEYYKNAEDYIVEDAPWVFFWHRTEYTLRQPRVRDYKIYPVYSIDKGLEIGL